jgi:hypothetical protein
LAPMPTIYLYPEARAQFPAISPINLTMLLQQIARTYRAQRYELLWAGTRSLATYRYPVPAPVHGQAITLEDPEPGTGWPIVRVRLGARWWTLRLVGDGWQRSQLATLRLRGFGAAGALRGVRAHVGDHRHQETRRRVLLQIAGWWPKPVASDRQGDLIVTTEGSNFLRIHAAGFAETIGGDALRRTIRAYETRRAREGRRRGTTDRTARHGQRIKTQAQQFAAAVGRIAATRRVSRVVYEDEERGFCDPFPWALWRQWLQQACEGRGLTFVYASGTTGAPPAEVLAHGEVTGGL